MNSLTAGAVWVLERIYQSLLRANDKNSETPQEDASLQGGFRVSSRSGGDGPVPHKRGSPFSQNLHLRLLLHIYGDLHQPLHTISLFARDFPQGDAGGNEVNASWGQGLSEVKFGEADSVSLRRRVRGARRFEAASSAALSFEADNRRPSSLLGKSALSLGQRRPFFHQALCLPFEKRSGGAGR